MDVSEHVVNHLPKITKRLMVGWLVDVDTSISCFIKKTNPLKNMFALW